MKIILIGYCAVIFIGTCLLSLPVSVRPSEDVSVLTSFFTATSATCVTGLVRVDTYTHWSTFGQAVILMLIQIGGIGFMTFCIAAITLTHKKIGLATRSLMQNSISAPSLGGIVRMTKFIFYVSIAIESVGAILLAFYFCPRYGLLKGIWFSIFHSISAFCNAGFDLMGGTEQFSSFTHETGNWYLTTIIMLLIIIGGLGFFVLHDIGEKKYHIGRLRLHSKIVLFVSLFLIFSGAFLIFILENGNEAFEGLSLSEKIAASFFQSVSPRTAGFNTVNLSALTEPTIFLMICLMMIGGSAGSTAGGIKTTTFAVLTLSVATTFHQRKSVEVFGRRLEENITRIACCVTTMYFFLSFAVAMALSHMENVPFLDALFESVSAIATVGLTTGITPTLQPFSHLLLALLMLFGRAGSLTILLAFSTRKIPAVSKLPMEKIQIG